MEENIELVRAVRAQNCHEPSGGSLTHLEIAIALDNPVMYEQHASYLNETAQSSKLSPLHVAAIANNTRFLKDCLQFAAQLDAAGVTALMYACECNSLEFVYEFAKTAQFYREIYYQDAYAQPALYYAIRANNVVLLHFLKTYITSLTHHEVFLQSNMLSLMMCAASVDGTSILQKACDYFTINSEMLLQVLLRSRCSYDDELAIFQRQATPVQWKRYLIYRPEIPARLDVYKSKGIIGWRNALIQNALESLTNGCVHVKLGKRAADGLTPLYHLLAMRLDNCDKTCPKPRALALIEYLDSWRHRMWKCCSGSDPYRPVIEDGHVFCHVCWRDEFLACFKSYFAALSPEYAVTDEKRHTSPLHIFLQNAALIRCLGVEIAQDVIRKLAANANMLDRYNEYPLLILVRSFPAYGFAFSVDFLEAFIKEAELDGRCVICLAENGASIQQLLPSFLAASRFIMAHIKTDSRLYRACAVQFEEGKLDASLFVRVVYLYVENRQDFFSCDANPIYALDFERPCAAVLIRYLTENPQLTAQSWFRRLLQISGPAALQMHSEQRLNPISRVLQMKDGPYQRAFLDFLYGFSDQLSGRCYGKHGVQIAPYELCPHDPMQSLLPEVFYAQAKGFRRPEVAEVPEDTDLIRLIKKADYRAFCQRAGDFSRDFGKSVARYCNTALIYFCITFGAYDITKCSIFAELARAEHGCCDKDSHTAAFYLVRRRNAAGLETLLQYDDEAYFADYSSKKCRARTLLHEACAALDFAAIRRISDRFPKLCAITSASDGNVLASAIMLQSFERNYDKYKQFEASVAQCLAILPISSSTLIIVASGTRFPRQTKELLAEAIARRDSGECTTPEGYNQLMICARYDIQSAIPYYQKSAGKTNPSNEFAALLAMRYDSKKVIFKLISWEHMLKYRGDSLLHIAIKEKKTDIALYMAEKKYCAKERDADGRTALMLAVNAHMDGLVSILAPLECGIADTAGRFAIHYALLNNNKAAFRRLFTDEFAAANGSGGSLLQYAMDSDQEDAAKFVLAELLKHVGDPREYTLFLRRNYSHAKRLSLHQQFAMRDYWELFEFLLAFDCKVWNTESHAQELVTYVLALPCTATYKMKYVERIISKLRYQKLVPPTPLMFAAANGVELDNVLFSLLFEKEREGAHCYQNQCALEMAATCGNNAFITLFLQKRKIFTDNEKLSLMAAVRAKNEWAMQMLLQFAGARDKTGSTALMECARLNFAQGCRILLPLERGIKNPEGKTALWIAVLNDALQAVLELISEPYECVQLNGKSLLFWCIENNALYYASLFSNLSGQNAESAFYHAVCTGNAFAVDMLLSAASIQKDVLKAAFYAAAQHNQENVCEKLYERDPTLLRNADAGKNELPELFWGVIHGNDRLCCICKAQSGMQVDSSAICAVLSEKTAILCPDSLYTALSERIRLNDAGDEHVIIPKSGKMCASMVAAALDQYTCLLVLYERESECVNQVLQLKAIDYAVLNDAYKSLRVLGKVKSAQTDRIVRQLGYESIFEKVTRNM